MWKAREKRCVFNKDLKMLIDLAALIWGERLFQSSGAATAKARSPLDLSVQLLGTVSKDWSADACRYFLRHIYTHTGSHLKLK